MIHLLTYLWLCYHAFCNILLYIYRFVEGAELFTCGNFVYNHYHDCKDANHFLSADSICDVICIPTNKVPEVTPVLACQDRVLRVLQVGHISLSQGELFYPSLLTVYLSSLQYSNFVSAVCTLRTVTDHEVTRVFISFVLLVWAPSPI